MGSLTTEDKFQRLSELSETYGYTFTQDDRVEQFDVTFKRLCSTCDQVRTKTIQMDLRGWRYIWSGGKLAYTLYMMERGHYCTKNTWAHR